MHASDVVTTNDPESVTAVEVAGSGYVIRVPQGVEENAASARVFHVVFKLLANEWRGTTRPLFSTSTLIGEGYALTECVRDASSGRVHYIFDRGRAA